MICLVHDVICLFLDSLFSDCLFVFVCGLGGSDVVDWVLGCLFSDVVYLFSGVIGFLSCVICWVSDVVCLFWGCSLSDVMCWVSCVVCFVSDVICLFGGVGVLMWFVWFLV